MTTPSNWLAFERSWRNYLRFLNKRLKAQGRRQISRYHAADCSSRVNEFEGWSVDEQIALTKELLAIFERSDIMNAIAYNMPLNHFVDVFPEHAADPVEACYVELLKFLMLEVADQFTNGQARAIRDGYRARELRLVMFHDRCNYDVALLQTFKRVMADPTFDGSRYFTTMAPLGWEDCIPLQGADLIAYECFKDAQNPDKSKRRKTLDLLLKNGSFGGRSKSFTLESIRGLRDAYDRFSTQPPKI